MNLLRFHRVGRILIISLLAFFSLGIAASVVTGNAQGSIVMEEFFDYQCPHCRVMLENTEKLAKNNQDVKLVTRVVPLLDRSSWIIARAALAARNQGKYVAMHRLLMQQREYISEERVLNLARTAGLDIPKLQRDMRSKAIAAELNANIRASRMRGVDVIPAIFVSRADSRGPGISLVGDKSYRELQNFLTKL